MSPFLKTLRIFSGGTAGLFDFLGSIGNLKSENEKLIEENQRLVAEVSRLKDESEENRIMRKELELGTKKNFHAEAGFIIAQDPQGLDSFAVIDKGKNAGFEKGMPVIISNGLLVGRIAEVFPNTTRVVFITDPESAINARIEDSGARGIVRGEFGLGIKMDMISQVEEVKEGDTVITSGLGGEMPHGLVIGRVNQASQSSDRLFQQATLLPAVDFSELRIVFVIKTMKKFVLFIFSVGVVLIQLSVEGSFFRAAVLPDIALAFVILFWSLPMVLKCPSVDFARRFSD